MPFTRGGLWLRTLLLASAALLVVSTPAFSQEPDEEEAPKPGKKKIDKPRERERWFYQQRSAPHGYIPGDARLKALERLNEMRKAERAKALDAQLPPSEQHAIAASTTQWTPIGPRPGDSQSIVGLISGRVASVVVNPLNQDEVYVGGAQGGVWRSLDGGATWTPLTDSQPSLAAGSLAIDATTCSAAPGPVCQTIYVGTGEQVNAGTAYYGAGILKTTDGGSTWTQLTGVPAGGGNPFFVGPISTATGGARIGSLAIQPGTGGATAVILAGVQVLIFGGGGVSSGVFRSADGGATWTQVISGAVGTEVLFDPANPTTAYAALGSPNDSSGAAADPDNGIYKSTNGGATWTKQTLVAPATANLGRIELSVGPPVAPSTEGVLYASIANATTGSDTLLAVIKSVNGGTTWTHLTAGTATTHCNSQCWYDHVIKVHPNDANVVYMGGAAGATFFARTTDGGTTWTPTQTGSSGNRLHVDIQSMAFGFTGANATRLFVGNDGGVWRADVSNPTAGGANPLNWVNLNSNLQLTQFYPGISFHPATPDVGFGGSQDNGTLRFDGQLLWIDVACGDGGWTIVDAINPANVYAACQNIELQRSVNGGTSFTPGFDNPAAPGSPINQNDEVAFIPPFIVDPNSPLRLYFGTCRVWLNSNAPATPVQWTAISPDLTGSASGNSCPAGVPDIRALAVAPSDSNVLYAGTLDGRVQRTTQALSGGAALNTWVNLTAAGAQLPIAGRAITWIAVHPTNPNMIFVSYSGFSGNFPTGNDPAGHLFRGTVSGSTATWVDITAGLPNVPVNVIVIDPVNPNTVYLGTDVGVFFATDANVAAPGWTTLVTGLPRVAVLGLALHGPSRTLRAATHGRGMWDLIVPTNASFAITNITPSTATAGSAGFTLTVDGIGFTGASQVRWNGSNRTTTFVSPVQLTANIPASDIATAGTFPIVVFDPGAGLGTSNARSFIVSPAPPPNDDFANAIVVNSNPFTNAQDTTNATNDPNTPQPTPTTGCPANFGYPGSGFFKSIWYRFTPTSNVSATVDTIGTTYDSVLSVYTGAALGALTQVDCDDDGVTSGGASRLSNLALQAGVTYHFMVAGFDGSQSGPTVFNFVIPSADLSVALTDAPDPVNAGSNLTYTAVVSNAGPTAASSATLTYNVPANVTFGSGTVTGGSCANAAGTVTCTLPAINSGSSVTVTLVVTPGSAAVGTPLNATVTVNSTVPDPVPGNNSSSATTTVNQPPDFSLAANPTTITVTRGGSGTSTITLTSLGGFTGQVALTCTGLPAQSSCAFNPTPITGAAAAVTSTLTITTTAGALAPPMMPRTPWPQQRMLWPMVLLAIALSLAARAAWRNRAWRTAFALAAIFVAIGISASCGGGGGGSTTPPPPTGTPRGTFNVTVTGTSGATTRTTTISLTVN